MPREKRLVIVILILILLVITLSCRHTSVDEYYKYSLDDKVLSPYTAMYRVDRERYCLTEIDPDSKVAFESGSLINNGFSTKLHMISDDQLTFRTVAFVRERDEYIWIGEVEIYYSGQTYVDPDEGQLKESLSITYNEKKFDNSGPLGLHISYWGPDESISLFPTCEEAMSLIRDWEAERATPDSK